MSGNAVQESTDETTFVHQTRVWSIEAEDTLLSSPCLRSSTTLKTHEKSTAILFALYKWGLCACIAHTKLPPSPVILWIELRGKPKWLPLNFGYQSTQAPSKCQNSRLAFHQQMEKPCSMCTFGNPITALIKTDCPQLFEFFNVERKIPLWSPVSFGKLAPRVHQ